MPPRRQPPRRPVRRQPLPVAVVAPGHYVAHDIAISPADQRRLLAGRAIALQPSQLGFNQAAFGRNRVRVALTQEQLDDLEANYQAGRPTKFQFDDNQIGMHGRGWGMMG